MENLPVFGAIVLALYAGGVGGALVDGMSVVILATRVVQSLVDVCLVQTNAVASVALFLVQAAGFLLLGRLLITFLLCHAGVLSEPLLYLSLYFKQNHATYYALLDQVRREGDWEGWLAFFLDGVRTTADGAIATAQRLAGMFAADRARIEPSGRRAGRLCVSTRR